MKKKTAILGSLITICEMAKWFWLLTVSRVLAKMEEIEKTAGPQCCCLSVFIFSSVTLSLFDRLKNTHGLQLMEPLVAR